MGKKFFDRKNKVKKELNTKFEEPSNPDIKLEHNPTQKEQQAPKNPQQADKSIVKAKKFKHNRIIIRNLVFDINQKHIRKLLAPYGEVTEVNIPRHPDRNGAKGFAFVEMSNRNMCLKAIKALNGSLFKGRKIILDESVSKLNYMAEKLGDKKEGVQGEVKKQEKNEGMEEQEDDEVKEKENQEESQEAMDEQQNAEDDENKDDEDEDEENSKQAKMAEDRRSQIFIRNLPISVTEEQLLKKFRKYGKVQFAKIVMNKQTNTSKGTAFVKYHDPEVAEKLIEYSRGYEMYMLKKNPRFKPDPTIHLEIDGAFVKIFPVESRNNIQQKLKSRETGNADTTAKKKPIKKIKRIQDLIKTDPHGKRKLEFAKEGKWQAEEGMNKFDYEKFKAHEKEKIQKLKNPNNSVSSNRLILKFLDKSITEEQLRDLSTKYLTDNSANKSHLTYCKLMLDSSMTKSAGFAFVEFKKEEQASGFLKQLISNPQQLMNRPFVAEYAIQDSRKLLKLKKSKLIKKQEGGQKKDTKKPQKGYKKNNKGGHKSFKKHTQQL